MSEVSEAYDRGRAEGQAAERERCAKLVAGWAWGREDLLDQIAAAIRKGEPTQKSDAF